MSETKKVILEVEQLGGCSDKLLCKNICKIDSVVSARIIDQQAVPDHATDCPARRGYGCCCNLEGRLKVAALAAPSPAAGGDVLVRWRDVATDGLPTKAQEVLFVRDGKTVYGAFIGGLFWDSNQKCAAAKWMPMPEPDLSPVAPAAVRGEGLDDAMDAKRYRRLRILGCAPYGTKQLKNGNVLCFSNLDVFLDDDLNAVPNRGDWPAASVPPAPANGCDHSLLRKATNGLWICESCGSAFDRREEGGIFVGVVPDNLVINENDLDAAVDAAIAERQESGHG